MSRVVTSDVEPLDDNARWLSVVVRIHAAGVTAVRRRGGSPQLARVDALIAAGAPARVAFRQMAREAAHPAGRDFDVPLRYRRRLA